VVVAESGVALVGDDTVVVAEFSARIGCQVYNPVFGMDLGALCIRGASRE
jgi:hypothetical protein